MKKTPKIVTEAILGEEQKLNSTINIYPLTIQRYAFLEMLNSPFIDTSVGFKVSTVIPSAFVMCSENDVLKSYHAKDLSKLTEDSFDWADEKLDVNDVPALIKAVVEAFNKLNEAAPSTKEGGSDVEQNGTKKK